MGFDVLYEDNHLLVIDKPAPLPTQGAAEGEDSVAVRARAYLKEKYDKPGNVYVGIVSRLDSFVTGVLVLARTSKAAGRLSEQFASGKVEKKYVALLAACPDPRAAECEDWLRKDDRLRRVVLAERGQRDAKRAVLRYEVTETCEDYTTIAVDLLTGRKHQIRAQLAGRGYPIIGDRKYGSRRSVPRGIALHCASTKIVHPKSKETLTFAAEPPGYWPGYGH